MLRAQDAAEPSRSLTAWTHDLIGGRHPTFRPGDATLVVDRRTGVIVSCLPLLSHTWTYGGVPIAVGQPELIGTLPERRGGGPRFFLDALSQPPVPAPGGRVRPAAEVDVPFLVARSDEAAGRSLLAVPCAAALWRYELTGKRAGSAARREISTLNVQGVRLACG